MFVQLQSRPKSLMLSKTIVEQPFFDDTQQRYKIMSNFTRNGKFAGETDNKNVTLDMILYRTAGCCVS
jgi:hypothetical protein